MSQLDSALGRPSLLQCYFNGCLHMSRDNIVTERAQRANQMLDALEKETDRGKACVGDAMLDELFEQLFTARLIDDQRVANEMLNDGQPLGNYGVRIRMAYLLGWIGPETYRACRAIHKIRNKMAHSVEIDSFDHEAVRDLFDGMTAPKNLRAISQAGLRNVSLRLRKDTFLIALLTVIMQVWRLLDESTHARLAGDLGLVPLRSAEAGGIPER